MTDKQIAEGCVDALCAHHIITHEYELQTAIIGAKWMQEQLIDKACKWLDEHLNYDFTKRVSVEQFKKAMEE